MLGEFVQRERVATIAVDRQRQTQQRLIEFDPQVVGSAYNHHPFIVRHHLAGHPLLTLDSLFALCRRLPDAVQFRRGVIPGDAHFDSSYERFRDGLSLEETLDHFEALKAYICIYNPERDPVYRPLLQALLAEIAEAIGPADPVITWFSTYIFISTSGAVTPYHMDREMNFLLQVRGDKQVLLWDPNDEEILSPQDKDRLLFGAWRPDYKPSFEPKAMHFDLHPGLGVHHPFLAPHRVHTLDGLSVSLAFTFRTHKSDLMTQAHCFNERLRRLGMSPRPVGQSEAVDRIKAVASTAAKVPIELWRARKQLPLLH